MNRIARRLAISMAWSMALPSSGAIAQTPAPPKEPVLPLEYAAKFVCGRGDADTTSFAAGAYYTAVNIHNPKLRSELTYKVALALPGRPGGMTGFRPTMHLEYDEAFEIDCRIINAMLEQSHIAAPPVHSGFLVIQSITELDVVAVYTTAAAPGQPVTAIHTERVPVRPVK